MPVRCSVSPASQATDKAARKGSIRRTASAHSRCHQVKGESIGHTAPAKRRALGLACIPEDRLGQGAVPPMRLSENVILTTDPNQGLTQFGFIRMGSRDLVAETIVCPNMTFGVMALAR